MGGLQHELESAKARIELQLGQDLDAKTAALERRLAETVANAPNPWASVVEALEGRVLGMEATIEALRNAAEKSAAVEPVSRDVALDTGEKVLPEDFRILSEKVETMEPQL